MIRFDGYYVYEPTLYQEREEWEPWYFIKAIQFKKNNKFSFASKHSKDLNDTTFVKNDFKFENQNINEYYLNEKEMYLHQDIGQPWEDKFYYDRISDKEFVSRQTGRSIKFVPWE